MKIEGRTFVITGGASGLGRATAEMIGQNGGNVAILDLNADLGKATAAELGPFARFFPCDVTSTESIARAVEGTVAWVKETGKELGGIVPAAGIANPGTILDRTGKPFDLSTFDLVIAVNVRGVIDTVRQFLEHLAQVPPVGPDGERGVIVLVASTAAFEAQKGQVAYGASKGAIAGMTLPMTRDLARYGVRVVSIAPSPFRSPMEAMMSEKVKKGLLAAVEFPRRSGEPVEFAALVKHSIENSMLNGSVIRIDGGMRLPSKM
ncbi:probable 3-hydroxyacyl-CoA dehydrogenase [Cephalotrichum gorgonifer]|uniref:Probable 3-hydroxyacyl-CoA dehydrogenase n=1 Tax=Cephalotrichum gorgonifer TaxID=2041049 RepID=A0AAE8MXE5_9PEZI|nr:probable 3-hydroxyacyl-CoA dehydrogenase [Cephalotrichum gorgonifer]